MERKSDGLICVIKQIEIVHMSEKEKKEAQREATVLQMLEHQNIIKYMEHYKTKKGRFCIVMDYAEGNKLITYYSLFLSKLFAECNNKPEIQREIK